MGKTNVKVASVVAAVVVGVCGLSLYALKRGDNGDSKKGSPTTSQPAGETAPKLSSSLDKRAVSYEGQTGQTALAILKSLADVKTKDSSYGEFVTAINGVEADGSKEFWSFYVNGTLASEGAGTYKTTKGEMIQWKVEAVQ